MDEIKRKVKRAQHWRQLLDVCIVNHQWEWCLYAGLYETATWTNRGNEHEMFGWSK